MPAEAIQKLNHAAATYLGTSHRKPAVKDVVGRLRDGLRQLFSLPEGYEVVLGNGGTTVFWDAATFCLIDKRSQHLSFGEFSSKFAAAAKAAPFLDDPLVIQSETGTHPDFETSPDVDAYCTPHNETSTGVMVEIRRPSGADPEALMLVDATSGAGGLRVDPSQFDSYYFAPQKAFASDGGLWISLCSPAAIERIERLCASERWVPASLDLSIALTNSRENQTYNTPALATLFLTVAQIEWMLANGGLEFAASRCDRSAEILYGWAEASDFATPYVAKPDERSRVVGTIDFESRVNADELAKMLRANGIVDTESYRKLGRNQLRIALFPAIDPEDVAALTRCIDYVAERLSS